MEHARTFIVDRVTAIADQTTQQQKKSNREEKKSNGKFPVSRRRKKEMAKGENTAYNVHNEGNKKKTKAKEEEVSFSRKEARRRTIDCMTKANCALIRREKLERDENIFIYIYICMYLYR